MTQIQIRVTEAEKHEISHNATLFGSTISSYGRMLLLNPGMNMSGEMLETVATALCKHAQLVNQLPQSTLRDDFEKWEEDVWRSIA